MSSRLKLFLLFILLCGLILTGFFLWGKQWETWLSAERARTFFEERGAAAGLVGAGLLVADLVLPIPSSAVIGGMGAALGMWPGFLWGWAGLVVSGFTGYAVARIGGRGWADKLTRPEERGRYQHMFDTWGGLTLVSTRMLPILPEVLSVMAGLYRMHFGRFTVATLLGTIPPALVYAWLGARAVDHPGPAIWALVGITVAAWLVFQYVRSNVTGIKPNE